MPRATQAFVMSLDSLSWAWFRDPLPADAVYNLHVWPVFFKIDGATVAVSDAPGSMGKLMGTATVSGTMGVGPVCVLTPDGAGAIPAEIGQWIDQVVPIPLGPKLGLGPDVGGIFGVALVAVDPGALEDDALLAGHAAFNDAMQTALDDLISKLPPFQADVPPGEIDDLVKSVRAAIKTAVTGAIDFWDKVHVALLGGPAFGSTQAHYSQDELPAAEFDQKDFDPTSESGPAPLAGLSGRPSSVSLNGAISRSRRNIGGQGVLGHLPGRVEAVAGYTSPDGYQHAIAATNDGTITELYWQGSGQVSSGVLTQFGRPVAGLAGYSSADGYQHAIAATNDRTVTEVYWQGSSPPGQGALSHFDSQIVAIAGYAAADGYQHVIVATADGNLTELYWLTGEVGRGGLTHLDSPVVDLAGYEAGGVHHVIAATKDGTLTELTWRGPAPASSRILAQVEAHPWNHLLGIGAYDAAYEQHVIVAMSNGTLREFHTPSQDGQNPRQPLHTDLAIMPLQPLTRPQTVAEAMGNQRPILDAYSDPSGNQHVIVSTPDGGIHELWWNPAEIVIFNP